MRPFVGAAGLLMIATVLAGCTAPQGPVGDADATTDPAVVAKIDRIDSNVAGLAELRATLGGMHDELREVRAGVSNLTEGKGSAARASPSRMLNVSERGAARMHGLRALQDQVEVFATANASQSRAGSTPHVPALLKIYCTCSELFGMVTTSGGDTYFLTTQGDAMDWTTDGLPVQVAFYMPPIGFGAAGIFWYIEVPDQPIIAMAETLPNDADKASGDFGALKMWIERDGQQVAYQGAPIPNLGDEVFVTIEG